MKYYEITIETTSEASELVAEILTDAGSNGISIFDPNDLSESSNKSLADAEHRSCCIKETS